MTNRSEKFPIINLKQLLEQAEQQGWPFKKNDVEHGFIISDLSSILDSSYNDSKVLSDATKAIQMNDEIEQIFFEWPHLEYPMKKYALHLTRVVPSVNGYPLLDVCLKSAVDQFYAASEEMFNLNIHDPASKLRGFILGLTKPIPEILHHKIFGELAGEWTMWPPLSEPFYDWLMRNKLDRLLIVPNEEISEQDAWQARLQVTHEIFSYQDLTIAQLDWKQILNTEHA